MRRMVLGCVFLCLFGSTVVAQTSGIIVTGEGTVSSVPDMATIVLSVVTEDTTPGAAVEANNANMSKLIKNLTTIGIAKKDLHTNMFQVGAKYSRADANGEHRLVGYTATNALTVTMCRTSVNENSPKKAMEIWTDLVGRVLESSVKNGANRVENLSWGFESPGPLMDAARVAAVKDAQRKADVMVKTAGSTLGTLVSIQEGQRYPRAGQAMYQFASGPGSDSVPLEAGMMTLRVTVNVQWNVGPPLSK